MANPLNSHGQAKDAQIDFYRDALSRIAMVGTGIPDWRSLAALAEEALRRGPEIGKT